MSFTGGRIDRGENNLGGGSDVNIDDTIRTKGSTWSSSKIGTELDGKAKKMDLDSHIKDMVSHVSTEEKEKLSRIEEGAEKNKVTSVNGKIGDVVVDTPKNISELNDDINIVTKSDKGVSNGVATLDINGLIPISQLPAEIKQVKVVNDIEDRNVIEELFEGLFVHVLDASGDEIDGGVSYIYDGSIWHKVAESDKLDAVLDWFNIENKPTEFNPSSHTHKATDIIEDESHRFASDAEKTNWNNKSDFSGNYADLINKPSIPSKVSELQDDVGIITDVSDKSDIDHAHDDRYYTREEIDEMDFWNSEGGEFEGTVEWNNVIGKPLVFPPIEHNHDDRYYTKEEAEGHVNFVRDLMEQEQGKVATTSGDTPDFLENKVDNVTVTVHGAELKVKSLDGLTVGITDINSALEGVNGNVQTQLNDLLSLLESLSGGMKFKDIAETRAEIDSWGNKENGDVAVVLVDETRGNGRSMYVYSDELGMWRYLGTFTFTTKFTALEDTPSTYDNGKYLKSTNTGIIYSDIDYGDLTNKPNSTITQIDDAVVKRHEHGNKDSLDNIGESSNGAFTYKGVEYVRKPDLVIPQKKFMYARRSGDQALSVGSTCIFNTSVRGEIPYNSSTGVFTLEGGKTYRITVSASINTEGYVVLHLVDINNTRPHSNSAIWTDITRDWREASAGPLDVVFSPSETKDYQISVSSLNGVSKLRGNHSSLVVQEL